MLPLVLFSPESKDAGLSAAQVLFAAYPQSFGVPARDGASLSQWPTCEWPPLPRALWKAGWTERQQACLRARGAVHTSLKDDPVGSIKTPSYALRTRLIQHGCPQVPVELALFEHH